MGAAVEPNCLYVVDAQSSMYYGRIVVWMRFGQSVTDNDGTVHRWSWFQVPIGYRIRDDDDYVWRGLSDRMVHTREDWVRPATQEDLQRETIDDEEIS